MASDALSQANVVPCSLLLSEFFDAGFHTKKSRRKSSRFGKSWYKIDALDPLGLSGRSVSGRMEKTGGRLSRTQRQGSAGLAFWRQENSDLVAPKLAEVSGSGRHGSVRVERLSERGTIQGTHLGRSMLDDDRWLEG